MPRHLHITILLLLVALTVPAHAYIDPGTGSFVLQIIIGGVTAAFVAIKMFWGRLRNRVKKAPGEPHE